MEKKEVDIPAAYQRIKPYIHRTPVFTSTTLNNLIGKNVHLKLESFQKTGSFKYRGALNAVLSLPETAKNGGVVAHSSGNHGQALAAAAKVRSFPCTIVVPEGSSKAKMQAIVGYGSRLVSCPNTLDARKKISAAETARLGATFIAPYDHPDVISGQGTVAIELLEQVPYLDAILVPVSGGGLLSGISLAAKSINPKIKIFAVEPKGKNLEKSLKAGKPMWTPEERSASIDTIADGLRTRPLGELTWPIASKNIESDVFTVSSEQMQNAVVFLLRTMKVLVEPSSAIGVAALLDVEQRERILGSSIKNIGVVVTGGNVDMDTLKSFL
eukprot:c18340_g1_i1.p1 GENE.c18340_g1_i1~~c18340_g1_i1.p1  ORF type:complete len:327 (+),score=165.88 c18340_g1_i1:41-1021(+)